MVCLDFLKEQPLWASYVECRKQIVGNFLLFLYRLAISFWKRHGLHISVYVTFNKFCVEVIELMAGLCHILMMIGTPAYLGVSVGNLLS